MKIYLILSKKELKLFRDLVRSSSHLSDKLYIQSSQNDSGLMDVHIEATPELGGLAFPLIGQQLISLGKLLATEEYVGE